MNERPIDTLAARIAIGAARETLDQIIKRSRFKVAVHAGLDAGSDAVAEVERLRVELTTARAAALEEAARIADDIDSTGLSPGRGYYTQGGDGPQVRDDIATAIRAAIGSKP